MRIGSTMKNILSRIKSEPGCPTLRAVAAGVTSPYTSYSAHAYDSLTRLVQGGYVRRQRHGSRVRCYPTGKA